MGSGTVLEPVGVEYAKTGTAEFGTKSPPETHAWMVAGRGDIAIAAYNEVGENGVTGAAPFILSFLKAYDPALTPGLQQTGHRAVGTRKWALDRVVECRDEVPVGVGTRLSFASSAPFDRFAGRVGRRSASSAHFPPGATSP